MKQTVLYKITSPDYNSPVLVSAENLQEAIKELITLSDLHIEKYAIYAHKEDEDVII